MLIIVAYDITDDRRRESTASELKNFGKRVQKSVFECYLDRDKIEDLKGRIERHIHPGEDSIRYYYLCKKDEKNVDFIGQNVIYRDEDYFMI